MISKREGKAVGTNSTYERNDTADMPFLVSSGCYLLRETHLFLPLSIL